MRYWTASEGQQDATPKGVLRLVRTVPPDGALVPAGTVHAVHVETTRVEDGHTVCWEPLVKLVPWRYTDFESPMLQQSRYVRPCGLCLEYVVEDGR